MKLRGVRRNGNIGDLLLTKLSKIPIHGLTPRSGSWSLGGRGLKRLSTVFTVVKTFGELRRRRLVLLELNVHDVLKFLHTLPLSIRHVCEIYDI